MKNGFLILILILIWIPFPGKAQNARQAYRSGLVFMKSGDLKDAFEQFTRAVEIDPGYVLAYIERAHVSEAMGDLPKAAEDLNRAIALDQKQEAILYDAARIYFLMEQYTDALDLINKSLKFNSRYEEAYRLLCRIQLALADYPHAMYAISKALSLKDNAENYFYRGEVTVKMKDFSQAEADYTRAIAKNNRYIAAYLALAAVRLELNKPDAALENCNAVLALEPGNAAAYLTRSRIYVRLAQYPRAIDDISMVLHNNPDDKEMYVVRGTYYQEFTQHQNAISDFNHALMIDNTYADAIYKRAYSYEQTGDFKSAIRDYETLMKLSSQDMKAQQLLNDAKKHLFELNRETTPPQIMLQQPEAMGDSAILIATDKTNITIRGRIVENGELSMVKVNNKPASFSRNGENYEYTAVIDVTSMELLTITATDVYDNRAAISYSIVHTEIDPPVISILAPYASDNGEIYLDTDNPSLYIEGSIQDASPIKSIVVDSIAASFRISDLNPRFSVNLNVENKDRFRVTATDIYGNDTSQIFVLNRQGVSLLAVNPMGRTWVIFIENSNYGMFPSLEGPGKDIRLMRSALERYDIHKIIYKQNMTKKQMERFFSIELRDLLRSNQVNSLLIWYAGHGKSINETGYWIPVDARRDDESTFYNLSALRASLQSYVNYISHDLVVTDACEPGPAFYQESTELPADKSCDDGQSVKSKSSQVLSSDGYEEGVYNSPFTKTFATALTSKADTCLSIESIVSQITQAVSRSKIQTVKFGRINSLGDEEGTFFFIPKNID